ncbi:thioredoxin family protein [Bacillus spongiae]|uniref:Thioredoxin family protein n=1 Tax=Bacillus spongiae TaxID=2683610 RepID=A0ABU8HF23_9BACI
MIQNWTSDEFKKHIENKEVICLYLYTPMCGTCQVAGKMLEVTNELLPSLDIGKMDLNYAPELADEYGIESVPCLLTFVNGMIQEKVYAFQSVPFLYEKLLTVKA